jgi:hypothetical protein
MRDPNCPDAVIGLLTWHFLKAAFGFCGEAIRYEFFVWLTERRREGFDLCAYCGNRKEHARDPLCKACWNQCELVAFEATDIKGPVQ